jgi:hypothetical protein
MNLPKLAVFSRKIHRILVVFITVLGTVMAVTGVTMHEAGEGNKLLSFIDINSAEEIHNTLSVYFAVVLALMIITGLFMYLFPYLTRWFKKPNTH